MITTIKRENLLLPAGSSTNPNQDDTRGAYLPTQEEIQDACLTIQSTWSTLERRKRQQHSGPELATGSGRIVPRTTIRTVSLRDIAARNDSRYHGFIYD
jgi:hypothetical protein